MKIKIDLATLTHAALFVAVFFLPLKTTLSNFGIIALCATSIVSFFTNGLGASDLKKGKFYFFTTVALYAPFVLGTLYAPDQMSAFDELERTVFYLLVPMVLLRKDLSRESVIKTTTWALLAGSVLCMLYLHGENLYRYFVIEDGNRGFLSYYHTGNKFVAPLIDMHPVYLGSYFLMLAILLAEKTIAIKKAIVAMVFSLVLITLLFLSSRIVFLVAFLWGVMVFFKKMKPRTRIATILLVLLGGLALWPVMKDTYVYNKLVKGAAWELGNNVNNSNLDSKKQSDSRMARWDVSWDMVLEKPFIGHGTGTEQTMLMKAYAKNEMHISETQQFNAHNQFLGYAIQFGFVGMLLLICYFLMNFKLALSQANYLLLGFCTIVFCCCLTENYLIRNMGVNFVAIFGAVLHLKERRND